MTVPLYERIADDAVQLYRDHGLTAAQVARRLDVSPTVVLDALRYRGVRRRPAGSHGRTYLEPLALFRARRLYEQGRTIQGVADELGISHTAAHHRLRKAGVEFRPRGTRTTRQEAA